MDGYLDVAGNQSVPRLDSSWLERRDVEAVRPGTVGSKAQTAYEALQRRDASRPEDDGEDETDEAKRRTDGTPKVGARTQAAYERLWKRSGLK